jgi:hypothetical protein
MLTVPLIIILLALVFVMASMAGRAPLWVPVFLLVIYHLLGLLPR